SVRTRSPSGAPEEPRQAQADDPGEDAAHARAQPRVRDRRSQPDAARLVRLLQARPSQHLARPRPTDPATPAGHAAQADAPGRHGQGALRPSAMAQGLLRQCRAVRTTPSLANRATVSMTKPPTGEPYAGKPPVRFGGRGG